MTMDNKHLRGICLLLGFFLGFANAQAQSQRDPTQPPISLFPSASGGSASASVRADTDRKATTLVVIDGQPHYSAGGRLYAQGQKMGQSRVERITETEVWLRQGDKLIKISVFSGVQRRAIDPVAPAQPCLRRPADGLPATDLQPVCGSDTL